MHAELRTFYTAGRVPHDYEMVHVNDQWKAKHFAFTAFCVYKRKFSLNVQVFGISWVSKLVQPTTQPHNWNSHFIHY